MKRKLIMIVLLMAVIVLCTNIFAAEQTVATGLSTTISGTANNVNKATGAVNRIWNSVKLVLQVVSVSIVLACGVRYMMASADQKADIKKSLGILAIGCTIVFGATIVIDFITTVAGQIFVK